METQQVFSSTASRISTQFSILLHKRALSFQLQGAVSLARRRRRRRRETRRGSASRNIINNAEMSVCCEFSVGLMTKLRLN